MYTILRRSRFLLRTPASTCSIFVVVDNSINFDIAYMGPLFKLIVVSPYIPTLVVKEGPADLSYDDLNYAIYIVPSGDPISQA